MRVLVYSVAIAAVWSGPLAAQSYATYDQPGGATTSISSSERIELTYPSAPLPASVVEGDEVQSVPVYESYEPLEFDAGAYQLATEPAPLLPPDAQPETVSAEIGFQSESETSRLLRALEDTHAKRVAELKVRNLAQRKAMLDQFEKDAADPAKVIGLAGRMRTALAELDSAQKALLEAEDAQYMAAMLKVLDAAPSRVE